MRRVLYDPQFKRDSRIPRAWSHSLRVPQVGEEGAEARLWTVRISFLTIPGVVPLPVERTLPPPLLLLFVCTQEVWTEPIGLEGVRPMGRKLTFLRPVDFAKISRSSRLGYRAGAFLWENVRRFH